MVSVEDSIEQVAHVLYGRGSAALSVLERRELVSRLRLDGLTAEADTLWSTVLRDSISELTATSTRTC